MASEKNLSAVSHDIAHHAVSGLSWLHPHLSQACRAIKVDEVTLDVTKENPLPEGFPSPEPLRLASRALHKTFYVILEKKGFHPQNVAEAKLRFVFSVNRSDDYSSVCFSSLRSDNGREFTHRLSA